MMKHGIFAMSFLTLATQSVFATGGFDCTGKLDNGQSVRVSATTSIGIVGEVSVFLNDQKVNSIQKSRVPQYYYNGKMLGLVALDEDFNMPQVKLEYHGMFHYKNTLSVTLGSHDVSTKKVHCEID